jgi:hypothetical protein
MNLLAYFGFSEIMKSFMALAIPVLSFIENLGCNSKSDSIHLRFEDDEESDGHPVWRVEVWGHGATHIKVNSTNGLGALFQPLIDSLVDSADRLTKFIEPILVANGLTPIEAQGREKSLWAYRDGNWGVDVVVGGYKYNPKTEQHEVFELLCRESFKGNETVGSYAYQENWESQKERIDFDTMQDISDYLDIWIKECQRKVSLENVA